MPPVVRIEAADAYYDAHTAVTKDLSYSNIHKETIACQKRDRFCRWLQIPPDLHGIKDPVPLLQIFSHKVRTGVLAVNNKVIQKISVEQYICSVGQIFAAVGDPDPQFNRVGSIHFRLDRQLAAYKREDPPPTRFRPLTTSILHTLNASTQGGTDCQKAISDLTWIAFFFLLRPGEYCQGGTDTVSTTF